MRKRKQAKGNVPMRLLLVVSRSDYFWTHRASLARWARRAGFEVHVAARQVTNVERFARVGLHFHPVDLPRGMRRPLAQLAAVGRLAALYRRLRPDIVHHLSVQAIVVGGLAARLARLPCVVHGFTGLGALGTLGANRTSYHLAWRLLKWAWAGHHFAIFQNRDDLADCVSRGIGDGKHAAVIRSSGVDVRRFYPSPPDGDPIVLLAGRLIWPKGVAEFVEATRRVKARFPTARFVVVGTPDPDNACACSAEWLAHQHRTGVIEWWGHRDDMASVYQEAAVVALPSWYGEGVPKVLLEAAASGRPLVATDYRGCREVVVPGRTGYRVPPRRPDQLAEAIGRLLEDAELRHRMGRQARALAVSQFNDHLVARKTIDVYFRCLEASRQRSTFSGGTRPTARDAAESFPGALEPFDLHTLDEAA